MNREKMIELRDSLQALAGAVIPSGPDQTLIAALVDLAKGLAKTFGLDLVLPCDDGTAVSLLERAPARHDLRALIESFPTLRQGTELELLPPPGKYPQDFSWHPEPFAKRWAVGSGGEQDAALFVLSVWNPQDDWSECGLERAGRGRFDLHTALGNWDEQHRAPFVAWCAAPWWL